MKRSIDIKLFLFFILGFVLFTIIGTISHECGHFIIAKILGYEARLHYGSTSYKSSELNDQLNKIYSKNKTAIENGSDFDKKVTYEKGNQKLHSDRLLFIIGGPLQTILTGTIGLLFLFFRRKKIKKYGLKLTDWLLVFLTLFWLREVFNLVVSISAEIISSIGSYFGGDEKKISDILNLWPGTISIILGSIGLAIAVFVLFKIIPKQLRYLFILSGLIGGLFGFVLWMNILGPKILP